MVLRMEKVYDKQDRASSSNTFVKQQRGEVKWRHKKLQML